MLKIDNRTEPMKIFRSIAQIIICVFGLLFFTSEISIAAEQQSFESPGVAVSALANAIKSNDEIALRNVFGEEGLKLISSGDASDDSIDREDFINAFGQANKLVFENEEQATLLIGKNEWPMPIPLVKHSDGWRFDIDKGEVEILRRRIGRNELAAIQVCKAIIDAEREYSARHLDSDGVPVYAERLNSTLGKRDGLYWPTQPSETASPLGDLLAAADDGYAPSVQQNPYHGYYYRILTRGDDATDGTGEYKINGKMIGGFAVIAYPAKYAVSGVISFLASHNGVIYEKDLGQDTMKSARAIRIFSTGTDWKKLELAK